MIERVEAEADEATRQHYLTAENPDGLYAVLADKEEDDFALKGVNSRGVVIISLRA